MKAPPVRGFLFSRNATAAVRTPSPACGRGEPPVGGGRGVHLARHVPAAPPSTSLRLVPLPRKRERIPDYRFLHFVSTPRLSRSAPKPIRADAQNLSPSPPASTIVSPLPSRGRKSTRTMRWDMRVGGVVALRLGLWGIRARQSASGLQRKALKPRAPRRLRLYY